MAASFAEYVSGSEKALEEISSRAAVRLREDYAIDVIDPRVVYTANTVFLQELTNYLDENRDAVINIASLMKFSTQVRKSEDGEKGGNFVPHVELGENFKLSAKNDAMEEDDD